MHKKFEINRTKIKGGCQSVRKVVTHNSRSDLPLAATFCLLLSTFFFFLLKDEKEQGQKLAKHKAQKKFISASMPLLLTGKTKKLYKLEYIAYYTSFPGWMAWI